MYRMEVTPCSWLPRQSRAPPTSGDFVEGSEKGNSLAGLECTSAAAGKSCVLTT